MSTTFSVVISNKRRRSRARNTYIVTSAGRQYGTGGTDCGGLPSTVVHRPNTRSGPLCTPPGTRPRTPPPRKLEEGGLLVQRLRYRKLPRKKILANANAIACLEVEDSLLATRSSRLPHPRSALRPGWCQWKAAASESQQLYSSSPRNRNRHF